MIVLKGTIHRMTQIHPRIIHQIRRLALAIVLLPGLLSAAMALDCDCPCCDLHLAGHHDMESQINRDREKQSGAHGSAGCNQCTFNSDENPGIPVFAASTPSNHKDDQARFEAAIQIPFPHLSSKVIADRILQPRIRSAPIYLLTLSILC